MTLIEVTSVLRSRWRWIAISLLVATIGALTLVALQPRTYAASATLYVSTQGGGDNLNAAYQGSLLSEQRIKSYTELASSDRVAQGVSDRLGPTFDPGELGGAIAAQAELDTVLMTITATDRSPQRAADIANSASAVMIDVVGELEQPADATRPPAVVLKLIESAAVPQGAVSPSSSIYLAVGAAFGLAAGVGLALLAASLDTSVKSAQELESILETPVLGVVAYDTTLANTEDGVSRQHDRRTTESINKIRTGLQFAQVDSPVRTLLVTSATPSEGKTTSSVGLAQSLAALGLKVALVDTDLRRPRVAQALGLEPQVGVSDILVGRLNPREAVQRPAGWNFDVIASGASPPNPSEMLSSYAMARLLEELGARYDYVLLDSSPILPVTDSLVMFPKVDGVLFVCRYGETRKESLERASSSMATAGGRVVGAVLTMAPAPKHDSYYYSYEATSEDRGKHGAPPKKYGDGGRTAAPAQTSDGEDVDSAITRPRPRPRT